MYATTKQSCNKINQQQQKSWWIWETKNDFSLFFFFGYRHLKCKNKWQHWFKQSDQINKPRRGIKRSTVTLTNGASQCRELQKKKTVFYVKQTAWNFFFNHLLCSVPWIQCCKKTTNKTFFQQRLPENKTFCCVLKLLALLPTCAISVGALQRAFKANALNSHHPCQRKDRKQTL